jgi:hypothetical protein
MMISTFGFLGLGNSGGSTNVVGVQINDLYRATKPSYPTNVEGLPVPVTYGKVKVKGRYVYLKMETAITKRNEKTEIYSLVDTCYMAEYAWLLICKGQVYFDDPDQSVPQVLINDKYMYSDLSDPSTHFPQWVFSQFNDGTSDYIPEPLKNELLYPVKMKGIAHMFFDKSIHTVGGLPFEYDSRIPATSGGTMPKVEFIVKRNLEPLPINYSAIEFFDEYIGNNPAAVIYDILTDSQFMMGIDPSKIDLVSFNAVGDSFGTPEAEAAGRLYGINFAIIEPVSVRQILDDIRDATDVFLYSFNDTFYLANLYDRDAINKGSITDSEFNSLMITRETWRDVPNVFIGEFIDSTFNYEKKVITIKNEAAILMADGFINKKKIDLTMFIRSEIAFCRLNEIMQRFSFPRVFVECTVNRQHYDLRPGDLINIYSDEYSLYGNFRVTNIDFGDINDMNIRLSLVQAFEDLFDSNYSKTPGWLGEVPQRVLPVSYETVTFNAYSYVSNMRVTPFTNTSRVRAMWTDGQSNAGELILGTDFTVDGYSIIRLTSLWKTAVEQNSLGQLKIDCWQR